MKNYKVITGIRVWLIAVLFLFAFKAEAQKVVEIGFRYMPTVSDFEMKTSDGGVVKGEAVLGYGIGALLGFNFSNHVGIQAEVIYNSISQKYKEQDVEVQVNLKYINVPLLLSLNTNKNGPVNLNLVAGPQMGFNVGSDLNASGDDGTYATQAELTIKKSDVGLAYGVGVDFALNEPKTFRFGVGYRGVLGLIDIGEEDKNPDAESFVVVDQTKVKTYSLYLGISFLF